MRPKTSEKTQAARNQPVERARLHGSKKWVSSARDVGEAVAKFDAIWPSRWCTVSVYMAWPSSQVVWVGPDDSVRRRKASTHVLTQCCRVPRAE